MMLCINGFQSSPRLARCTGCHCRQSRGSYMGCEDDDVVAKVVQIFDLSCIWNLKIRVSKGDLDSKSLCVSPPKLGHRMFLRRSDS